MGDLDKILLTSALTLLGGVFVFVVGQLLLKFVIEPAHELRKAIAAVRYCLLFYAPDILTPAGRTPEGSAKARDALLKCSADLYISCEAVRWYWLIMLVSAVPKKANVLDAGKSLRGLSTYMFETGTKAVGHVEQVNGTVDRIERHLNLPSLLES